MQPLVSIIVPVYNVEKYLQRCVESLLSQTYGNLQIILVDDGSTDGSAELCHCYAAEDSRVVIVQKKNGGLASARNKGLEYVRGEYVGFVDSDDWVSDDFCEKLLCGLQGTRNCIAMCGRYHVDETTGEEKPVFAFPTVEKWSSEEAIRRLLIWDRIDVSVCDKLFPVSMIQGMSFPEGYVCEDMMFTYTALKRAEEIIHVGKSMYYYLQRDGSTSHSKWSEKTRGMLIYSEKLSTDVVSCYPDLKDEAEYYRLINASSYLQILDSTGTTDKKILCDIQRNLPSILSNSCFSFKEKMKCLLRSIGLFRMGMKVKKFIVQMKG